MTSRPSSRAVPGTSSAYAERVIGGYYLDIIPDRMALGRYGLSIDDVQDVIGMALGSEVVTSPVEGRERYGVAIRLPKGAFRSDPQSIARDVQVSLPEGGTVPLGESRGGQTHPRCDDHQDGERPARRLHLCRYRQLATSGVTWQKPRLPWRQASRCQLAIPSRGAVSSNILNGRRNG